MIVFDERLATNVDQRPIRLVDGKVRVSTCQSGGIINVEDNRTGSDVANILGRSRSVRHVKPESTVVARRWYVCGDVPGDADRGTIRLKQVTHVEGGGFGVVERLSIDL